MVDSSFLRSINIQLDVDHPERFEHFRPTSKSVRLVSSLLEEKSGSALFVVAPYGSGKSITAGYLGELVANRPAAAAMLELVGQRIEPVDPSVSALASERRERGTRGLFVPLYGHVPSAPAALKEGLLGAMRRCKLGRQARTLESLSAENARDVVKLIADCSKRLEAQGFDRLVIVWDEFGRHLQGLISEGRPEELDVLQVLAEVVSRTSSLPVSLVLLLHRSLLGYAGGLPSGVRREWAKIEGRFDTLQYIDDSSELYDLIGSLVRDSRIGEPAELDTENLAVRAKQVGLFPDVEVDRLASTLRDAYPLEPTTLYLLPRVAARVAQNERTLFSFLQWASLEDSVPPSAIYDYFCGDFRADGGAGGTQRPWLETESAVQKVESGSSEEEALKGSFLLGLGLSGERAHATYQQLHFALDSASDSDSDSTIDDLIDRKLLVHRRHSDQVVVWHGTDVDLRGRLDDEKNRSSDDFHLAPFLTHEMPPPVWRPVEYNAEHAIRRYCESEYITVDALHAFWSEHQLSGWDPGTDGRVFYVLPSTPAETAEATEFARTVQDPRLFIVVAGQIGALKEAALDLWCLLRMHADNELIESDPLVKAELDHLTDDARTGLQPMIDRVLKPQKEGSRWFRMGKEIELDNVTDLRRTLSSAMVEVFSQTPEIDSEMVVRRSPTSVVINARKKVELGLLERYGQEALGIEGDFADKAIFRCVFLRTGLYREAGNRWRLATPEEIEAPGLAAVWTMVRSFFTEEGTGKNFQEFVFELRNPPYGVREGVIPLLLAAGIKAFPTASAIRWRGDFVDDVLPSIIEDIARTPEEYVLDVIEVSAREQTYLEGVLELFKADDVEPSSEGDLLRACMDAVLDWRYALPPAVSNSRYLSSEAKAFERACESPDPVRLFFDELPRLVGQRLGHCRKLLAGVAKIRDELAGIEVLFQEEAIQALNQTLVARGVSNGKGLREQAACWAGHFPKTFGRSLPDRVSQGVLSRLRAPYKDDGSLVNALATLLVGRPIRQWDDAIVPSFRRQLRSALEVIEGTALALSDAPELDPELREGLVALAKAKTATDAKLLVAIAGHDAAVQVLEDIAADIRLQTEEATNP
jgi:hypothetical protein